MNYYEKHRLCKGEKPTNWRKENPGAWMKNLPQTHDFQVGQKIDHVKFGLGEIIKVDGLKLTIKFSGKTVNLHGGVLNSYLK